MNNFLSIVVAIITFLLLCYAYWMWTHGPLHPKPPAEPRKKEPVPTMFDVRRLLKEGDKKGATRLYAKIFKVPAKQADKDIAELERSLKV
jgi:hypothetical protein